MCGLDLESFWIHFNTDVLSDDENPAFDYRYREGLSFRNTELLLKKLLGTDKISGMSLTIYNPKLDTGGEIAKKISHCIIIGHYLLTFLSRNNSF